jgi:hypothetical protein
MARSIAKIGRQDGKPADPVLDEMAWSIAALEDISAIFEWSGAIEVILHRYSDR